jgi:hypothetical protein
MKNKNSSTNWSFDYFFAATFFISVLAGCIMLGPRLLNMDGDLGRHLTVGGYILDSGKIPTLDIFSHTMTGKPFTPHEWLTEAIFTLANRWLGLTGVVFLTSIIIALVWYLLSYEVMKRSGGFYFSLVVIIIGIAASSIHWISRPHIFTYIFLLIWIRIYSSNISIYKKCSALALIMIIWANSHGAFITGIVYIGIDIAVHFISSIYSKSIEKDIHQLKKSILIFLIACSALLINPTGFQILGTVINFLQNKYLTSQTLEYQPPNLLAPSFIPFTIFLVICAYYLFRFRKNIKLVDAIQIVIWSIFGIISARNIPLAIIVGLPILSAYYGRKNNINDAINDEKEASSRSRYSYPRLAIGIALPLLISIAVLVLVLKGPGMIQRNEFLPTKFPVKAVDYIMSHPIKGNMFNEFTWGGYLLYRLWPGEKVFIDGQTDFYGEDLTREYADVYNGNYNFEAILIKYSINWVIVRQRSKLAFELEKSPELWKLDYRDELSVIYSRK